MDGNAMTTAPKVVNGINVDDLFSLIESVRQDPAKGVTHWHVATTRHAVAPKSRALASAAKR